MSNNIVAHSGGSSKQLTKKQLDKLFKDVKLPPGDPIPDFIEPKWLPPNPDKSKMNKRGTDFGPCFAFTVQLDKRTFIRRGLTVRLARDHSILYDLDTMGTAATWRGGFLDISKTHYEDNKGRLPGRPGGKEARWVVNAPGWGKGNGDFTDRRPQRLGPVDHIKFRGYFQHGYRVVLSYSVLGRYVLEMPSVDKNAPPGCISRTLNISPGKNTTYVLLTQFSRELGSPVHRKLKANDGRIVDYYLFSKAPGRAIGFIGLPQNYFTGTRPEGMLLGFPASAKTLRCKIVLFSGDKKDRPKFEKYLAKATKVADLRNYVRGGPRRWKKSVVTKGTLGSSKGAYTVDTLALPGKNPWKSWVRPAAIDFFSDGRLVMSSMNGDVWICRGVDKSLNKLQWRRYATGLYEPLGLKIVKDRLYVLGRDRITRLHDLNLDGEADYYQTFWAGGGVAPGYHAFAFDLQIDSKGDFYFLKSGRKVSKTPGYNALVRVAKDGSKHEVVATGFRHPNGMGIGPNDMIVVSDNQGEFIPCSQINLIRKGAYYGYGKYDLKHQRPLLCLPMKQDNSSGGQLWAPKKWGPLSGLMLHTSYGSCKLFYVLTQFDGKKPVMATAIPFPWRFSSGIMRGRIHPMDGQVYLSGLRGWGTKAKQDGCLNRVRFTGKPCRLVKNVRLTQRGLHLEFTCKLNPKSAQRIKNYQIEQWNYIYSKRYGSPEVSVRNPGKKGHDKVKVHSARLDKNGRSVFLELPNLQPVDQLHVRINVQAANGQQISANLFSTLHRLPGGVK